MYAYCGGNPINSIDPSGHKECCVIGDSDFYSETSTIKKVVDKKFKIKNTKRKKANSYQGFKKIWNGFKGKQECVIIDSHATPFELSGLINNRGIKHLKYKKIKKLILLGCNAGHMDYPDRNVACNFKRRISGVVVASDGTVETDEIYKASSILESKRDKYWKNYRIHYRYGLRHDNTGWIKYKTEKKIIGLNKKKVTIKQLIDC